MAGTGMGHLQQQLLATPQSSEPAKRVMTQLNPAQQWTRAKQATHETSWTIPHAGNTAASHTSDKGFMYFLYKEFPQMVEKKTNNSIEKWAADRTDNSWKRKYKWLLKALN